MESKQLALTLHFYSQPHLISAYVPSWNQQSVKTKEVPVFFLLLLLTIGFFFYYRRSSGQFVYISTNLTGPKVNNHENLQ
jgi:hypothetical protein